jgi:hypothetical protein
MKVRAANLDGHSTLTQFIGRPAPGPMTFVARSVVEIWQSPAAQ